MGTAAGSVSRGKTTLRDGQAVGLPVDAPCSPESYQFATWISSVNTVSAIPPFHSEEGGCLHGVCFLSFLLFKTEPDFMSEI